MMKLGTTLLYHDVVDGSDYSASGFPGAGAAIYKLRKHEFERHLRAFDHDGNNNCLLTFDDGGSSCYEIVADLLESHGRRGHFFIVTDYIGRPGFLNKPQIRDLHTRGHVVGSHSKSHPLRITGLPRASIFNQWDVSVRALEEILGDHVECAAVPGGFYSRAVAETAAAAGIRCLFTSEPKRRAGLISGCTVYGRYSISRGVSAETAAALARGDFLPCFQQSVLWTAKKTAKRLGGRHWFRLRTWVLERSCRGGLQPPARVSEDILGGHRR